MAGIVRYRLAWVVCLLLLAGFLANSISIYYVSRDNVRRTISDSSLPLTSDNIYSVIQRDLLRPIFISSMMANDAFLRDWTLAGEQDVGQMQRYLDEIRREYGTITSFFISESSRNYYYWGGVLKQVDPQEPRDVWYFRVRDMQEPFEINVDYDMANRDTMTIFVNYRVYDYNQNFIGAAGTGLTVNRVNQLIEEYEERFGREIFFVDGEGRIVLSPEGSKLSGYGNLRAVPGLGEHAEELLEADSETKIHFEQDGKRYFLNSRFVPELNWFLMVEQSEEQLLSPLRDTLRANIGLGLLITAIVAAICISAISRHHSRLEARNAELSAKNAEIQSRKLELEESARELAAANASLSAMNREKDDFLGIVAHDLRSPLNGVLGLCEILRNELPDNEHHLQGLLADIRNSGFHMLELIGDILDVSSIESFHGPLVLEPCNWNALAREAAERNKTQAAAKGIRIEWSFDERANTELFTRGTWMSICLNNLLSNAIKYSPPGSRIWLSTAVRDDGSLESRVRDEGPGLPPEDVRELFQKFKTLSSKPTGGEGATGLGLYIVQKICQRLGGEVSVETEFGKGCCFIIHHPRHVNGRI